MVVAPRPPLASHKVHFHNENTYDADTATFQVGEEDVKPELLEAFSNWQKERLGSCDESHRGAPERLAAREHLIFHVRCALGAGCHRILTVMLISDARCVPLSTPTCATEVPSNRVNSFHCGNIKTSV